MSEPVKFKLWPAIVFTLVLAGFSFVVDYAYDGPRCYTIVQWSELVPASPWYVRAYSKGVLTGWTWSRGPFGPFATQKQAEAFMVKCNLKCCPNS